MAGALCAKQALVDESFSPLIRSAGMTLSPFNAWVVLKGLETLGVRMRAQSASAQVLAEWLSVQPAVKRVFYPGLQSHGQHALAMRQQSGMGGGVLSFELHADSSAAGRARDFPTIYSASPLGARHATYFGSALFMLAAFRARKGRAPWHRGRV